MDTLLAQVNSALGQQEEATLPASPITPLYEASPTSTSTVEETLQSVSPPVITKVAPASSALRQSSPDRRRTTNRCALGSGPGDEKDHHPVGVGGGSGTTDGGKARTAGDTGGSSHSLSVSWADDVVDKGYLGRARKVKHKMKSSSLSSSPQRQRQEDRTATRGPAVPPSLGRISGKQQDEKDIDKQRDKKKSPPRKGGGPQSLYEISLFYKTPVHVLVRLNPHLQYIVNLTSGDGGGGGGVGGLSSSVVSSRGSSAGYLLHASETKLSMFDPLPKGTKVTLPAAATTAAGKSKSQQQQPTTLFVQYGTYSTTTSKSKEREKEREGGEKDKKDGVETNYKRSMRDETRRSSPASASPTLSIPVPVAVEEDRQRQRERELARLQREKIQRMHHQDPPPPPQDQRQKKTKKEGGKGEELFEHELKKNEMKAVTALEKVNKEKEREREQWRSLRRHVKEASEVCAEEQDRRKFKLLQKWTSQQQEQHAHFSFPSFYPTSTSSQFATLSHHDTSSSYVPTTMATSYSSLHSSSPVYT